MRKLYSIIATVAISSLAFAQTTLLTEDFSSITGGNSTSTTGSGSIWAGNSNFPTVASVYQAGGSVKLGTASAAGSITSKNLDLSTDGGTFTVSFDVKGWTSVEGNIVVTAGTSSQTVSYAAVMAGNFETKTLTFTGGAANSTVTIATSAKRAFIDNVNVVTVPGTLATFDPNAKKVSLVKNTLVNNEIIFGAKANVQIINMAGQVVKTASVNDGTTLDISSLPKGVYIVSAEVNGAKTSQKINKR